MVACPSPSGARYTAIRVKRLATNIHVMKLYQLFVYPARFLWRKQIYGVPGKARRTAVHTAEHVHNLG